MKSANNGALHCDILSSILLLPPTGPWARWEMVHLHHIGISAVYILIFNDLLNEQQQQQN